MESTAVKAVITAVTALAMLAQELALPDWAQKSSLMACIAILAGLMLWVVPQMFNRLIDHGKQQMEANSASLRELGQKIDNQTIEIVRAISQRDK